MKYNAPYGVSDPNAAYINGNPTTGTMGSIPPAASIEYPQREIVNLIANSNLTPVDSDLAQLSKGIQSGVINAAVDAGTPNVIAITPIPPVDHYWLGQFWRIKVANQNTGPTQINVNGAGLVPLVHADLTPLALWELNVGQVIDVVHDGAGHFQLLSGGPSGSSIMMTAPRNLYVSVAIGSDTLYDGSQPTVSADSKHGPFQTIQKALSVLTRYNLGGWTFGINVADGIYNTTQVIRFPLPNGSGTVSLVGNHANPSAVQIYNSNTGSCFFFEAGGNWTLDGFSFRSTGPAPGDPGNHIWVSNGSFVSVSAVSFGTCAGYHMIVSNGSSVFNIGPITITGPASSGHVAALAGVFNNVQVPAPPNLTITAPVNFTQFAYAANVGVLSPVYGIITGAANVFGSKYTAVGNGVIDVGGRGVSYLPGNAAGTLATGGQLV